MLPKAPVTTPSIVATTLREEGDTNNNRLLKERVNGIGAAKVKLPLVEQYNGDKARLKGFLI
jgi:hypothetical protein